MPQMDGCEVTTALRKISQCPIVALTASFMEEEKKAKSAHFDGFLRKPILKYDLFLELSKFLAFDEISMSQKTDNKDFILSKKAKQNSEEIQKSIDEEIKPLYEKALQTHSFSDTKEFNEKLYTLAQEYEIEAVAQYAKKLQESIDVFDIEELEKLLHQFTRMIKKLYDKLSEN